MESSTKKAIAIALTAVMMTSVVGMVGAQEAQPPVETPADGNATVAFSDQTTNGTSVTVDSVNMSDGGFVVIHDDSLLDGEVTGSVIGVSEYLEPGETENVTVALFDGVPGATFDQTAITEDQTLIAMPHRDTNASETYDFVATDGTEDGPYLANGAPVTDSANVSVEEVQQTTGESFDVSGLTAPEVIERGTALNVNATIENPNDEADTQTVEYRFDGNVSVRETVSLDAGESTNVTVALNTSAVASDGYIHGVYTRERGQAAQVLIVDEIVSFGVTDLSAPESVTAGDNVTVEATVSNPNEFAIEQPIQFRFDGDLVETRAVELDGENETTVQFEIDTEGTPPGTYIHSVFSNDFGQDAIISVEAPDDGSEDGEDGEDGTDGEDGEDGTNGEDGEDGTDGEDGEDGTNGEDGEDGTDGEDSENGEDGTDGEDGEDGTNGEDGEDGTDGENGGDGTDGEDGEDGTGSEDGTDGESDSDEE
jgi:hypothetical protein